MKVRYNTTVVTLDCGLCLECFNINMQLFFEIAKKKKNNFVIGIKS